MLRRACGYKLANDGHDTRVLQAYLQHTVRYTELSPTRLTDVRFTPESDRLLRCREMTLCAMYGRRPRCKGKVGRLSEGFGCSHVFGLT